MRPLQEHPRLTIVKTLSAILLVVLGVAVGTLVGGGQQGHVHALELRMASARHSLAAQHNALDDARARAQQAETAAARAAEQVLSNPVIEDVVRVADLDAVGDAVPAEVAR